MARIGIFDSGIGGLSVLRELRRRLPGAVFTYFGDTANVPYGGRSDDEVIQLSLNALAVLKQSNPDVVVVACNTATSVAIQQLRASDAAMPIVGVVPIIKKAAAISENKKVAVLATEASLHSHSYQSLKQSFASEVDVLDLAVPEWVLLTEGGHNDDEKAQTSVRYITDQIKKFGADVVALGCTHFVFLRPLIELELPAVTILDSGQAVAKQVERVLDLNHKQVQSQQQGETVYWCSGDPLSFSAVASRLLGEKVTTKRVK